MHQVQSSNISAIGYEQGNLIVKFHSGGLYRYYNVPFNVYDGFIHATSHGRYLHNYINGRYHYSRMY